MSAWPTVARVQRHAIEHPYPQGGGRWLRADGHGPSFVQLRAVADHVEIWVGCWHWPAVGLDGSFRPVDKEGNPLDLLARVTELEANASAAQNIVSDLLASREGWIATATEAQRERDRYGIRVAELEAAEPQIVALATTAERRRIVAWLIEERDSGFHGLDAYDALDTIITELQALIDASEEG